MAPLQTACPLLLQRLQHDCAIGTVGVASYPAQELHILVPFLSEEFRGEGGFLIDQPIVHILIFLTDALLVDDCADSPIATLDGDEPGKVHLLHFVERLGLLLALESAQIGELREEGSTFMLEILLRWRSLARSTSFLCTTRLATGISLFITYIIIAPPVS